MQVKPLNEEMPPQRKTISLEEAQTRCELWAETFHKAVPEADVVQIPKAIWFHWADIQQIVDDYRPNYPIDGVRVYFSMKPDTDQYQITGLLVPTVPAEDGTGQSNDLIIKVPVVSPPGTSNAIPGGDEGDSIYDFSKPCPEYCNQGFEGRSIY